MCLHMAGKVQIYSTSSCKYCVKAKDFFNKIGREFEEIRFEDNPLEFQKIADEVGAMSVPIIRIGEKTIVGWNPSKIMEAL